MDTKNIVIVEVKKQEHLGAAVSTDHYYFNKEDKVGINSTVAYFNSFKDNYKNNFGFVTFEVTVKPLELDSYHNVVLRTNL